MNTKERIISLKLIEKKESHLEFLEEIGVAATVKVNDGNLENEEKNSCTKEKKNYGKSQIKWDLREF